MYKRGDVFWADLSPVIGSEQDGVRPVVILQNDIGNKYSPTVIVAPLTSNLHRDKHLVSCARLYAGLAAIFGCVVRTDTDSR